MINNLTMSKLAVKGDAVIGSFAVFSLHIGIMSQVALSGIMFSFQGLCSMVQDRAGSCRIVQES